jgi:ankyrin repeat protein
MTLRTNFTYRNPSAIAVTPIPHASLHEAAERGDSRVIRTLIADGVDVDARDLKGQTPLIVAIRHRQLRAAAELIAAGASLNVETRNGWTPLSVAVKSGNPFMIELIAGTSGGAVRA